MSSSKGKIVTVQGVLQPHEAGLTLTHEHLYVQVPSFYTPPKDKVSQALSTAPFEMKTLGWIRQNPYTHVPNLTFEGEDTAVRDELLFFKENGGRTIVENTTTGIYRDVKKLKYLSDSTGVNIVCGTGFYVDGAQTEAVRCGYTEEKMAKAIRQDIVDGVEGVKCGIIGEVGTAWPITPFEKNSLRASATVQTDLGCPVIIHPGRNPEAPGEAMRILLEAGGKAQHTVMSHLDRTIFDMSALLEYAELGSYLEYDLFGIEVSHYQLLESVDMPSDAQRIAIIKKLVDEGHLEKVLISHDIHTKHRLMKYGGHGYSHILLNIVPKMLQRGITQDQVDTILQRNPQTWLQFFK
ncbi:phosphotriesterase-related protein [Plakobranchus ocellatus]|uniref:Phosphotriesterase-related protein n=1 Tax=Plakobranchus ocellatus TaxID=259542 RepID=A0AAV3ZQ41_9GAST|nr:phosphotriesterase-related protein [Plakobranchus ocellatus]